MTLPSSSHHDDPTRPFSAIYDNHQWRGKSKSGPGSDPERTVAYRTLLEQFVVDYGIHSVVDLGCGDWRSSSLIDWNGASYTGVDIVDSVIADNHNQYGTASVSFVCLDALTATLPPADLLIVKEVLQHLSIPSIETILHKLSDYKFALLVNDISHDSRMSWRALWRWRHATDTNTDIPDGSHRLLDLRRPPFNLDAQQLLTYANRYRRLRWEKEVLLWSRGD